MVAKRYATLPSQVLSQGNSIDIKCAQLAMQYENYIHENASKRAGNKVDKSYSTEDLQAMLNTVRNKT